MYVLRTRGAKRDQEMRWALPDRVFFACGACHILAYAFLERHGTAGTGAVWLRPAPGHTGNHIFVSGGGWVFDYHGYSDCRHFLDHTFARAQRHSPDWDADLIDLPREALISESRSREFDGLWLREPGQFLHDAMPHARAFLDRFPPLPDMREGQGGRAVSTAGPQAGMT